MSAGSEFQPLENHRLSPEKAAEEEKIFETRQATPSAPQHFLPILLMGKLRHEKERTCPTMLLGSLLLMVATVAVAQQKVEQAAGFRHTYRIQQGQCNYIFLLPEPELCLQEPGNSLQRDTPTRAGHLGEWPSQRVRQLEKALENSTQRLQKLERYILMNLKSELVQTQRNAVQNQTSPVLELGTSLLNETLKLTNRKTQTSHQTVNQTSRMESQMEETLLSQDQLEKQLLLHSHELHRLQGHNSALETRIQALETQQQAELVALQSEKEQLQRLLSRHSGTLDGVERTLRAASTNSTLLQNQQRQLLESVQRLMRAFAQQPVSLVTPAKAAEPVFQDCAEIQRSGIKISGIYTIRVPNMTEPRKVFCDMETKGGGWTLIQRRENGVETFQRNWQDYKQGFGRPAGEHWLGNEVIHQLTSRAAYSLYVELKDWEGNTAYAQYKTFRVGSEEQLYRLFLSGLNGTAGRQSGLFMQGVNFSTRDADNDICHCHCAQLLSGGWWFDACGGSNLNGVYYTFNYHLNKLNGIRWQYYKGPSYSLRATRMMIRPVGV
ncbi:PREDICTED: angiopoietin-4 [Elephantulus edwardii]|uniref:angiopoietin-4 n=1 Tax=Elephantulus edwardii TaxID=28737 RepID=UPI0003F065B6|nr:PREDICTED: angiopoietin-4 [Elephantulus edwardii]